MKYFSTICLSDRKSYAAVGVLFLLLSFVVIAKAVLLENCMAFDSNDDVNHTFTGLYMAKKLLASGAMPYFNYYNNFGTPLMGDALTYPFAVHSIPYYLTDIQNYPLVMTFNRFLISFGTLTCLLIFYRTFGIGILSAAVAAIFTFFNFGYFWHFAHHHYQMTLFFAACVFTCQRIAITRNNPLLLVVPVSLLTGMMIYSVSANLVAIMFPFFLLHPVLCRSSLKTLILSAAALCAGLLLGGFQIITTIVAMMNSARSGVTYIDAFNIDFTAFSLILRSFFQVGPSSGTANQALSHVYYAVYFPLSCLLMYLAGLYQMSLKRDFAALRASVVLGFLPVIITAILLVNGDLWRSIPYIKSTDCTRVLWPAMIFVGIGIGTFSDSIQKACLSKIVSWLILIPLAVTTVILAFSAFADRILLRYIWGYLLACCVLVVYLAQMYLRERKGSQSGHSVGTNSVATWSVCSGFLLLTLIITSCYPVVYRLGNWNYPKMCTSTNQFSEMPAISPVLTEGMGAVDEKSRFAIDAPSAIGAELVSEIFGRHGAGGRSIALDRKLFGALSTKGLIDEDDPLGGYHFSNPWDVTVSNDLGLRYFLTPNEVRHDKWQAIGRLNAFLIYHNTESPSLVRIEDKGGDSSGFIRSFNIEGNDFIINIPDDAAGGRVYVTITARTGFLAYVDGKRHPYGTDNFNFIYVDTKPGDKVIRLSYSPIASLWQR